MSPKVSVITSTYYRPDLLRRCIKSVQRNIFTDYEHIIVSDHCPYAEKVYNEFKEDTRIRFVKVQTEHEPSDGAISKNLGIKTPKLIIYVIVMMITYLLPNHLHVLYQRHK
jgi:glycosyltransferase involved in cell wall biosynthesis